MNPAKFYYENSVFMGSHWKKIRQHKGRVSRGNSLKNARKKFPTFHAETFVLFIPRSSRNHCCCCLLFGRILRPGKARGGKGFFHRHCSYSAPSRFCFNIAGTSSVGWHCSMEAHVFVASFSVRQRQKAFISVNLGTEAHH